MTTVTYNFVSLIVKKALLESALALSFSLPNTDKIHCYVHLSLNSTLKLINGISNDPQKLLRFFNGTKIVAFFRIPLA